MPSAEYLQAVKDYRASYVRINAPAHEILENARPIVDSINMHLGYRFQITEASWSRKARNGEALSIKVKVRNNGVAHSRYDGYLALHLFANKGVPLVTAVDSTHNFKNLEPYDISGLQWSLEIRIPVPLSVKSNRQLAVSLGELNGSPVFALPHKRLMGHNRRYYLGPVRVNNQPISKLLLGN